MAVHLEPQTLCIRSLVAQELEQVALEHGRKLAPLTDGLKLLESGLDSLGLAIVVARLQDALGVDPFASGKFIESHVTLGEFVRMYERLLLRIA